MGKGLQAWGRPIDHHIILGIIIMPKPGVPVEKPGTTGQATLK
jgi:hypothetical protein